MDPLEKKVHWSVHLANEATKKMSCPSSFSGRKINFTSSQGGPAERADAMSSPREKVHNNLCKTAPLDKHNVAIYTPLAVSCRSCSLCRLEGRVRL